MTARFHVRDRVTVTAGPFAGARGRITQRAHPQVRPYLKWVVTFDAPFGPSQAEWTGVCESEIEPWTVPPGARPWSVGALQHPMRGAQELGTALALGAMNRAGGGK